MLRRSRLAAAPPYYLFLMTTVLMLNYMDRSIFSVLLVPLKGDLRLSDTDVGLLSGFGFVLLYGFVGVPFARLADQGGRHRVLGVGVLIWSLATIGCGFAGSMAVLFAARAGVGLGEAAGAGPTYALVSGKYPKQRRPWIMGIVSAGGALGTALGLSLGGMIAAAYGWRAAFFVAGAPGLIVGLLCWFTLTDQRTMDEDDKGSVLPSLAQTARAVVGQGSILFTLLGAAFLGAMLMIVSGWTPMFFARVFDLKLAQIGVTLGLIKGSMGIAGTLAGGALTAMAARRDDRWQAATPALACLLTAPSVWMFANASDPSTAFCWLAAVMFLMSSAMGPIFSIYQSAVAPRLRAQVVAVHMFVASIGLGGGPWIVGYLNDTLFAGQGLMAIRSSMMVVAIASICAAAMFSLAGLFVKADIQRTEAAAAGDDA